MTLNEKKRVSSSKLPVFKLSDNCVIEIRLDDSGLYEISFSGFVDNVKTLKRSYERNYLLTCLVCRIFMGFVSMERIYNVMYEYFKRFKP